MTETTAKRRRSRAEWQRLMQNYEASGQTQHAFCAAHGIAYSTFGYWRRKLRETGAAGACGTESASESSRVELPLWVGEARGGSEFRVELDLGNGLVLRLR